MYEKLYLSTKEKAKDSCNVLFLEIISEVIFTTTSSSPIHEPPEDKLVSKLLEMVISKQQLSPFSDSQADKILLIRSHFLQLLLDYEYDILACSQYLAIVTINMWPLCVSLDISMTFKFLYLAIAQYVCS